jgi:tetratricopeptide (TPR) repeat protein
VPVPSLRVAVVGVAVLLLANAGASAQSRPRAGTAPIPTAEMPPERPAAAVDWLERLLSWTDAVRSHRAGAKDRALDSAAAIRRADLAACRDHIKALADRVARARRSNIEVISYGGRAIAVADLEAALELDRADAGAPLLNRFARRAALLHSDVAIFAPAQLATVAAGDASVLINDGQLAGYSYSGLHWEFARDLLDLIRPRPSIDPGVRAWYLASGRLMRRQLSYGYSDPHLARAESLFPGDPEFAFLRGCLHESMAGARVQSYLRTAVTGMRTRTADGEFRRAEASFRAAVAASSVEAEARVRLGHVLLARGRAAEAASELARALALTEEPTIEYFASLLLGNAEEALGRREAAQEAYSRAASLFPSAQSPRLALGQVARRFGDRKAALDAMEPLFAMPVWRPRADPWWEYDAATLETQDELVAAIRHALSGDTR